jgi:hypothetical protein
LQYTNKEIHTLEYLEGQRHGLGKYVYGALAAASNQIKFEETAIDGVGKFIDEDGNVFEGTCFNGLKNGKGKTEYHNGDVYEGGIAYSIFDLVE